jgi:uncharacterized membrane protein
MSTTSPRATEAPAYTATLSGPAPRSDHAAPSDAARAPRSLTPLAALGWTAVVGLAVFFVATKVHYLVRFDARSFGPFWGYAGWLVPHVAAGMVALLIGPLQFRTALRQRYRTLHRWSGRLYAVAVLLGATMAVVMLTRTHLAGMPYRLGLGGLAVAWVGTTGLAVAAIRRGNVPQHREWMVRSYVVTFAFVTFRIIHRVTTSAVPGSLEQVATIAAWACWAVPLLFAEFAIQGRKVLRTPRRALPPLLG